MRRLSVSVGMAGLLMLVAVAVMGFESNAPGHRIHEEITREAAASAGLSDDAQDRLVDAVNDPDWRETRLVDLRPGHPWVLTPKPGEYRAEHHFDRGPNVSHDKAFGSGAQYVRACRSRISAAAESGSLDVDAIGSMLHALQDFFSHSNVVDLSSEARKECVRAIWKADQTVPASLRITAYYPNDREPEAPKDPENYTHGAHSKDAKDKNADASGNSGGPRSRFDVARALAVDATIDVLKELHSKLPAAVWAQLSAD